MKKARIGGNFAINALGNIATLAISLATVPIYVHQLGDARYGVLSIIWLLLGYFGFLDLGLSRAATNALSRLNASSDRERSSVFVTSLAINLLVGSVGSVLLYFAGSVLLDRVIAVPPAIAPEIASALPWVAALLPLALVYGVSLGTLEARERFLAANLLQFIGTSVGQILPVICAILIEPTLSVVVPVAIASRAFGVLLTLSYVLLRNGPWHWVGVDFAVARRLLGYGGWVTISGVISPVLQSLDQVIIGRVLGVASVTYYSVPMNLVLRSQLFAVALSRALFPRMSLLDAEQARTLSEGKMVTLGFCYAALCGPGLIVAGPFLAAWISASFSQISAPVAQILLVGGWINALAFIAFSLLQASGRPDVPAKFHLLEVVPFIAVLWLLATHFGLIGAAAAWALRVTVDALLLFAAAGFSRRAMLSMLLPAGFMLCCWAFAWAFPLGLGGAFLAAFVAAGCAAALALWRDAPLRLMVRGVLDRLWSMRPARRA